MTVYTISDLHLNHGNIIDYCDRPFEDADEMNAALRHNWNSRVDDSDTVIFLGDLAVWSTGETKEWVDRLNGDFVFVIGNHDSIEDPDEMPFTAVKNHTTTHNGFEFYCEHYPADVPDDADWWNLYGHHHNNNLDAYPFIDPDARRVNVSAELIDYTPLSLDRLCSLLEHNERYETLSEAPSEN